MEQRILYNHSYLFGKKHNLQFFFFFAHYASETNLKLICLNKKSHCSIIYMKNTTEKLVRHYSFEGMMSEKLNVYKEKCSEQV